MIKRPFESLFLCEGNIFVTCQLEKHAARTCIHIQKYIFQCQILHINMNFLLASFNILSIRLWNILAVSVLNNLRCTHYIHVSYEVCC